MGKPHRWTRTNLHLDLCHSDVHIMYDRRLCLHHCRLVREPGEEPQLERSGGWFPLAAVHESIVICWLWIPVRSYDKLKTVGSTKPTRRPDLALVAACDSLLRVDGSPNIDVPRPAYDVSYIQTIRLYKNDFIQDAAGATPVPRNYTLHHHISCALRCRYRLSGT